LNPVKLKLTDIDAGKFLKIGLLELVSLGIAYKNDESEYLIKSGINKINRNINFETLLMEGKALHFIT
jgi:hypothetical protein